eukprot:14522379-Alexandrium_andersonii.AAC.1
MSRLHWPFAVSRGAALRAGGGSSAYSDRAGLPGTSGGVALVWVGGVRSVVIDIPCAGLVA